ncbi:DUF2812 domain-containing protein [Gracilibacillus sp. S3-1-1]|uniref:DUF2812 domain-containing protein n=1 Tax=Gracilibacillus pellucidus TaxID=3095368 RepID=A0ACC6M374_9BACI|nr:DUF2812 domain-containing protein [Gracilibacillus sp. S3-1-1]MDX8045302.1 DUF2812 domain-containing protein [Gracilibacillus sp. S3-1-1]
MRENKTTKKVAKRFFNFFEEEQWLQSMLDTGWVLKSYEDVDVDVGNCKYVFEPITDEQQKHIIYKIDYRDFSRKKEFQEYKELFEHAGWTSFSKSMWYSKHIFYTTSTKPQIDIFSDQESYKEREKRKMSSSLLGAIIGMLISIVCVVLYFVYEKPAFFAAAVVPFVSSVKCTMEFVRHKAVYRSVINRNKSISS